MGWLYLYLTDLNTGIINLVLYFFYDREINLDDRSPRSERELKNLVEFIAYNYDCKGIRLMDKHDPELVETCKTVRKAIFAQMKNNGIWTTIFGVVELTLFFVGHFAINPYS